MNDYFRAKREYYKLSKTDISGEVVKNESTIYIDKSEKAISELVKSLKLCLNAFEKNWCIDWGDIEDVIKKYGGS